MEKSFNDLINQLKKCNLCENVFGFEPHPVFFGNINSKIVQISQAPSALSIKLLNHLQIKVVKD